MSGLLKSENFRRAVIVAVLVVIAAAAGVFLGHMVTSYELKFMLDRKYIGTYRGIDVYVCGDINETNYAAHVTVLSRAPEELTDSCDRMYFTGRDLEIPANDTGFTSAMGLTQNRTVYISTENYAPDVVLHELFHAYDNAGGEPSAHSEEFRTAFETERRNIPIFAGSESLAASEFYAQAGAVYLLSPDELKAKAPLTFAYFDKQRIKLAEAE